MLTLVPALIQMLTLLIQYTPELEADVKTMIGLLQSGTDPTPEEQAQIDAALERVNNAITAAAGSIA